MKIKRWYLIYVTLVSFAYFLYYDIYRIIVKYRYIYLIDYGKFYICLVFAIMPFVIPATLLIINFKNEKCNKHTKSKIIIFLFAIFVILFPFICSVYYKVSITSFSTDCVLSYTENIDNYMILDTSRDFNFNRNIFPKEINTNMQNVKYRYTYECNFFTSHYRIYLEYTTFAENFEKELERISKINKNEPEYLDENTVEYNIDNIRVVFYKNEKRIIYTILSYGNIYYRD